MKIIHCLNHFLPQQVAGTEVYAWALCKQLQEMGCDVSILIPNYDSTEPADYFYDDLKIHKYAEPSIVDRELITGQRQVDGLINFLDYLKSEKPDIIHFHELAGSNGIGVAHFEAAKSTGAKIVFTMHLSGITCHTGTLMFENKTLCDGKIIESRCAYCALVRRTGSITKAKVLSAAASPLYNAGINLMEWQSSLGTALSYPFIIQKLKNDLVRIYEACDMMIPITDWYANILKLNGVPNDKLKVIKQALPFVSHNSTEKEKRPLKPLKIIFVGRIDELKGITLMLNAIMEIPSADIQLDIYGSGPDANYISSCKTLTGQNSNISWMGKLSQPDVIKTMMQYDALILPSMFSEMSPLVIQEAFAAGIPVIGSNVYGIEEQVKDGVNGLLFEFGNKESLLGVLRLLIDDHLFLDRLSVNIAAPNNFKEVAMETMIMYRSVSIEKVST